MIVDVWSDVVCPWCYIGKRRFEAALGRFAHAESVEVRWHAYELDPRAPARRSRPYAEAVAAKYGMTVEQARARLGQMNAMAAAEGLEYDLADTQGGNTFDAHRLVHYAESVRPGAGAAMEEALFRAYFTELRPIGERTTLLQVAEAEGFDVEDVTSMLDTDRFAVEVRGDEQQAAELGCTGVPFFVVDGKFAIPGAQDPETFLAVLDRAWARAHPEPVDAVDGSTDRIPGAQDDEAGSCSDDACDL